MLTEVLDIVDDVVMVPHDGDCSDYRTEFVKEMSDLELSSCLPLEGASAGAQTCAARPRGDTSSPIK